MDDINKTALKLGELLTDVVSAVIGNPSAKSNPVKKIKISKIGIKGRTMYQFERIADNKAIHENIAFDALFQKILGIMSEEGYKQCSVTGNYNLTVLMNKDRLFKITGVKENVSYSIAADTGCAKHNKQKNYILSGRIPWMTELGLMDENGVVINAKQKKFRQINRFLEMLKDVEAHIPKGCTIVDMGCGKSYLTFAMYHYLNIMQGKNVKIMGFDLKKDVVDHCNELARLFGFDGLEFFNKDIAEIDNIDGSIGMIITLHACDTATDIALFHGIRWGCGVIMSVPCCQHELFPQIKNPSLSVIMDHGILKERFAALFTDGIRAKVLEIMGYKTNVMEFIDMEHTPKNIMIRAVKTNSPPSREKKEVLKAQLDAFCAKQCLYELCFEGDKKLWNG